MIWRHEGERLTRLFRNVVLALLAMLALTLSQPASAQVPDDKTRSDDTPTQPEAPVEERIAILINQLAARYYDDRENAREQLERIGTPAEPFLVEAMKSADFRVRYYAATVLGKIGSEECIDVLVGAIGDEDRTVVAAAKQALLQFGEKAVGAIERQRKANPEAAQKLEDALKDLSAGKVEAALQKYLVSDGMAGFFPGMFDEVAKIGKPAIPTLVSILNDPNHEFVSPPRSPEFHVTMRRLAADALGDLGDPSVIPVLQKVAEGDIEDEYVQGNRRLLAESAMFALYKLGDKSYVERYRQELEEKISAQNDGSAANSRNDLAVLLCRIQEYDAAEAELKLVVAEVPTASIAHYNLACIYASRGKRNEAIGSLREAVKNGYVEHEWTLLDGDLRSLHEDKDFLSLVQEMKTKGQETRTRRTKTIITPDGIRIELPEEELPGTDEGLEPQDQNDEPPIDDDFPPEDEIPPEDDGG